MLMLGLAPVEGANMRIKFQYKLLLALVAILIMTASTISYVWYTHSQKLVTDTMLQSTELLLNERIREIDSLIENIDYQSRVFSYNNANVDRGLGNKWHYTYLNAQAVNRLNAYIDNVYASSLSIQAIELGNSQGDFYGRGIRRGYDYIKEEGIDKLLFEKKHELLILPYSEDGSRITEIMFYRNVYYYDKAIGYSMISIDYNAMVNAFEGIFPPGTLITVHNNRGDLLYSSKGFNDKDIRGVRAVLADLSEDTRVIQDPQGREWLVIGRNMFNNDLPVHVAVPMAGILGSIKSKFKDIIMISLIMFVGLLLIVLFVSKWIGRNMSVLTRAIQRFSEGDMVHKLAIRSNDEFSQVAASFNQMTQSIRQLLADIKAKEQEKFDLEIQALQRQINMHFLFNALNTIKNLSYIQRVTNIERLVSALMELLHISMADGKNFITLETELQYVEHYLEIYKYKSVKLIECVMEVDEDAKQAVIPKFMLQPIVENAIIHGIEATEDDRDGIIRIQASRTQDVLDITITDNGKGFEQHEAKLFSGIGIANTDQRIKMNYGERYGLQISSVPNESATVFIRIPYRKEMRP
jgi:two-component system, sensor histidine kinase YesM